MADKYKQPGRILDWTNGTGGDVSAGDVIIIGVLAAVALVDIADGEEGAVAIEGVFELPKAAGTAWTAGATLDWDESASAFTIGVTPAAGDLEDGAVAAEDAASAATVGLVRLTPNPAATAT